MKVDNAPMHIHPSNLDSYYYFGKMLATFHIVKHADVCSIIQVDKFLKVS